MGNFFCQRKIIVLDGQEIHTTNINDVYNRAMSNLRLTPSESSVTNL